MDLSYIDPRFVINYLENAPPNSANAWNGFMAKHPSSSSNEPVRFQQPQSMGPMTTVTPFGPILPTSFSLPSPDPYIIPPSRSVSSSVLQRFGSMSNMPAFVPSLFRPPSVAPAGASSTEDAIRRILETESSSESEPEPIVPHFQEQATAVPSPVAAPCIPPVPAASPPSRLAAMRTPRTDRMRKKRDELEQVQQFLEKQRVAHEKLYSNFDVKAVRSRDAAVSKRRSLSDCVSGADNVAQLRRNIADATRQREVSPLPPVAPSRTPSASSRSPKPVSPDRLVSGVFVSYPRKRRSISAPHSEAEKSPEPESVIPSLRPGGASKKTGKMNPDEYAELKRNLLSRSEQHAVTNTASSVE